MLSMTSSSSAFRPYYRPDQLLVAVPESKPLKGVYSDPEPAASSPAESGNGKNRRKRTTFTQHQAAILEKEYMSERYMVRDKRAQLAEFLGLSEAQVKTWFQNRRAKDKREKKGGSTSPQRSPSDSANVSLADDSILDTSQASTMSPSPPAAVPEPTPPSELKPQITPSPAPSVAPSVAPSMATAHQAISTLLQPRQLQEFPPYFSSLGLAPLETIPSFLPPPPTVKTEPGCAESTSKEIYKLPFNIYDHPYPALYAHIPLNLNPISSANSPSFIPEPLAPIANTDTLTVEHTQLTAL